MDMISRHYSLVYILFNRQLQHAILTTQCIDKVWSLEDCRDLDDMCHNDLGSIDPAYFAANGFSAVKAERRSGVCTPREENHTMLSKVVQLILPLSQKQ